MRRKKQKSIYNENVDPTKKVLLKVLSALYEQKLVSWNLVKKQNYLNNSGPTKAVNVLLYWKTKRPLVETVKKLNRLNELSKLNCLDKIG